MIETLELEDYGPATRFDVAYVIDEDGYILIRVLEPDVRGEDENFPEERFREAVRKAVRMDIEPPYAIQWNPGRDNVEEEEIE